MTQKLVKLKRKYQIIFIEIYITTQEFNKFTKDSFAARVKQASLASGSNMADFVKKTDFDGEKKKRKNQKVASNKTKHVEAEKKLNYLLGEVKLISTKRLTEKLINVFLIGAKYFFEDGSQNYFNHFLIIFKHLEQL